MSIYLEQKVKLLEATVTALTPHVAALERRVEEMEEQLRVSVVIKNQVKRASKWKI